MDNNDKVLLVMRHGKAKGRGAQERDFDRGLRDRGLRDAAGMGAILVAKGLVPDVILSSPARRAVMTAETIAESCGFGGEIVEMESLYLGSVENYMRVLGEFGCEEEEGEGRRVRVMVVGHQPGLSQLIYSLTGRSVEMVTSAIAVIRIGIAGWSAIEDSESGAGKLDGWYRPGDID